MSAVQEAVKDALRPTSEEGFHNSDLDVSRSRVIEGATWKKQRIVVIVPAGDMIPAKAYLAHWGLIFPPNQSVYRHLAIGEEVGKAYTNAIKEILANPDLSQWEYILTMENDNLPPQNGVLKLIAQMEKHPELHCIGGLYWCKGPEGCAHIWGDVNDPILNYRPQPPQNGKLIECYGTSMGFNLWRLSMFKDTRLKQPWFETLDGSDGRGVGTQDLQFWTDARKFGYRCAVDCDVRVGHVDYTGSFGVKNFVW